jgi:DNA topoisomerase IA
VLASYGHVRDLLNKPGAVNPASDFAMTWSVPSAGEGWRLRGRACALVLRVQAGVRPLPWCLLVRGPCLAARMLPRHVSHTAATTRARNTHHRLHANDAHTATTGEARLRDIASAASRAGALVLATDPDREGEAISWHITQELQV